MLHILAHSLYKAHAFLSSGSALAERSAAHGGLVPQRALGLGQLAMAGMIVVGLLSLAFAIFGLNPLTKPGGLLLGGILSLALTHWVAQVMRTGSGPLVLRAVAVAGGLCLAYSASFVAIERLIAGSLPASQSTGMFGLAAAIILTGFVGMFALNALLARGRGNALLHPWRVHAANGFYFESLMRRALGPLLPT
jgi:NAD(P)H-quinone oxidoreductase subunit 5